MDLGASEGKIFLGGVQGSSLVFEEVHRFGNRPVQKGGRHVWGMKYLFDEIVKGLKIAGGGADEIKSLGVDTWGVDFGLIKKGKLMRDPYSYRDPPLTSTLGDILGRVTKREIFLATGINHWNVPNSLWQYHYLSRKEPEVLQNADQILMMPQLISFMLGGKICGEETIASTTQMFSPKTRTWANDLLRKLDLSVEKLPKIEKPGEKIGVLKEGVSKKTGIKPDILLPASHDTAAAIIGMPLEEGNKIFLSTGSWFIVGVELDDPCLTKEAFEIKASNEMGVENTVEFDKCINGFFLLEECRKKWKKEGEIHKYEDMINDASKTEPFGPLIDPDDELFTIGGDMPEKITSYCGETGQEIPKDKGEITRCILESLAVKTAMTLEDLMRVANISSERLYLGGGGARNRLFCQMFSSAAQIPVYSGPVEASAVGNILVQAKSYSEIGSIEEGRRLVRKSFKIKEYTPQRCKQWMEARSRMENLVKWRNEK